MPIRPEDADKFARERAFLIAVDWGRRGAFTAEESLAELEILVAATGAEIVGAVIQRRRGADAAFLIGSGKAEEVAIEIEENEANVVVFDEALSPAQQRNLETKFDVRVIDRPTVILDIFARRAQTNEGRLQVELAQLEYQLPRLRGWGGELSRLAGGIGTRGPGETKLESDRRRVVKRIDTLKAKLRLISRRRQLERAGRRGVPLVAIAGYTNTGKTTLLNRIAASEAYAADLPFATLDPTVKRVRLPSGQVALFADTVGFIANLPSDLVAAFRATFEEIETADILLVVSDLTAANPEGRAEVVEDLLTTLGARDKPRLDVFNKLDCARGFDAGRLAALGFTNPIAVSAATGEGVDALLAWVEDLLAAGQVRVTVELAPGPLLNEIFERGRILSREYAGAHVRVTADVPADLARRLDDRRAVPEGNTG
jgi:GTP-binding protein HflX